MKKELYLYSTIYDFVAETLISQLEENKGSEMWLRMNTQGGDVFAGWGIVGKMCEIEDGISIKVDGSAMSMGAAILPFAKWVECLDVSSFMIHRANMYCSNAEDQAFLDGVNKKLREKLEAKIDGAKLKELKGVTIKDLFENETRIDCFLTAKEAKEIGLVNKINTCTPMELTAIANRTKIATEKIKIAAVYKPEAEQTQKPITMTADKLKIEHPEVFASVLATGIEQEKERIQAYMVFNEIDPVAVKAGIESGKPLGQVQMAEFTLKAMSKKTLKAAKDDSAEDIDTGEANDEEEKPEEKELKTFEAEARKLLKLS
jgi:ATP-dependent Clp protease protease subunit